MKWLVATRGSRCLCAARSSDRPIGKWPCTWTTEGATSSSTARTRVFTRGGRQTRKVGWMRVGTEGSRYTVRPGER